MNGIWAGVGGSNSLKRLIAVGTLATLVLIALSFIPLLIPFLPWWINRYLPEWIGAALIAAPVLVRTHGTSRRGSVPWLDRSIRALDRVEAFAGTFLERWLVGAFAGLSVLWLLLWVPHYLYWPVFRDADTYAQMALDWTHGVLPYRDIRAFNFPGHIYLHWVLGRLFGWGRTGLFYAFDVAALVSLGAILVAWSRRRLGLVLPGTLAYVVFLRYYLGLSFENVAQRDWHAPLCATLGLLILQAWPGRRSRWASAILTAAACTIRPNIAVYFPALLVAAMGEDLWAWDKTPDDRRVARRRAVLAALEWLCVTGVFVVIGFTPLTISGVLDDFVRGLAVLRRGGPYNHATSARSLEILVEDLQQPRVCILGISLILLSFRSSDRELTATSRAWLLALLGALLYRPFHPQDHFYLRTPLMLTSSVAWAIPVAWIVRASAEARRYRIAPLPAMLAVLLIVYEFVPVRLPGNCNLHVSIDSIRAAASGRWPELPPGAWTGYGPKRGVYGWDPYCLVLQYIREETAPTTIVANVLKQPPFPSLNGAAGRRSPFRVESGVPWMWVVEEDLDEEFAGDLERLGCDSIVVWSPEEIDNQLQLPLRRLTRVILDRYTPEARFGKIEVWRRKCSASDAGVAPDPES